MVVAVAPALLVAACAGPSTMRIVNRTQVPVVVSIGSSALAVGSSAERTVSMVGGEWGGGTDGLPHVERTPPGAYTLTLPWATHMTTENGRVQIVLAITRDVIAIDVVGDPPDGPVAGSGTFPPDPAAVECAGSPPPQPSPSASSAADQGAAGA